MAANLILVTGATGYIAGKLIPQLLERGYRVRCLVRDPSHLNRRAWCKQVEVTAGDLTLPASLEAALDGVGTAYYLVHSMASGRLYPARDLAAARNFSCAAAVAGVEHIIYLGGLADPQGEISPHMRSRIETGQALLACGVPVTEFRAGVIVGPGSISFEMIRYLAEQFPLLVGPTRLRNRSQPIADDDVLAYLLAALEQMDIRGRVYEVGGSEVMTYAEVMLRYARERGLRRSLVTLPGIPLGLMAALVGLLTPVPPTIARPLIEGLQADSLVQDDSTRRAFPAIIPRTFQTAVRESLARMHPATLDLPVTQGTFRQEGFLLDVRRDRVAAPPATVYQVVESLGGPDGWFFANWLWRLRGELNRLLGGPGMRGRPRVLREGAVIDFYRVEVHQPGRRLRLYSELKTPGDGWMEWSLDGEGEESILTQVAYFAPKGLGGFLYWSLLGPIHRLVFKGLQKRIAQRASAL
ncbi:MAG: DUF2867 domain-containing protein [Anaerolineales bacterium]|nr:DUF2867 domain-containing protein [Anaerolineales bacterium]